MRNTVLKIIMISICYMYMSTCNQRVMAQDQPDLFTSELLFIEIADKLISYNNQLLKLEGNIEKSSAEDLAAMDKRISSIDMKWNLYNQSNQLDIANNDSLLQLAANFQLIKQELSDSIAGKRHLIESKDNFKKAEDVIFAQDTVYANFYDKALKYSKVKKLAPLLEKLKIKEQLVFADIQASYEQGISIGAEFKILESRTKKLEEKFIELKNTSEKIQALEFKPFFQRFKDELMGLAAVSMILMFFNMIQSKIKLWKQTAANAKKMKEMLKQNDNEYPTI